MLTLPGVGSVERHWIASKAIEQKQDFLVLQQFAGLWAEAYVHGYVPLCKR